MMKRLIFVIVLFSIFVMPVLAVPIDCMSCHGSTGAKYPLLGAKLGYAESGHATLGDSRYANAGGCQRCHTNEGYVEYATKFAFDTAKYDLYAASKNADGTEVKDKAGNVVPPPFISNPSQPGCFTCHDPHTRGDFLLRTQKADAKGVVTNRTVTLYNKFVFSGGAGSSCASCHMERGAMASAVASAKGIVSPRGNSHHGPEADMLAGTNGYEFAGKKYGSSPHYSMVKDTCVTCHMEQPNGRYGFSPKVGGHAFTVVGEVHEAEVGNISNCLTCHGKDVKVVASKKIYLADSSNARLGYKNSAFFNIKAKADYDKDGSVEFVQLEVQGLIEKLQVSFQKLPVPILKADGTFAMGNKNVYPNDVVGAYQNYLYVIEDKSLGVHNTTYAIQLLMDSIAAVDPTFDVSARP